MAFSSLMIMVTFVSAQHATNITAAAINQVGTLFPDRLGDELRHRRTFGHRLDHDDMARVEDHLVQGMPLLAPLNQDMGLLLGLLVDDGLDGRQIGHFTEIHRVVTPVRQQSLQ